MAKLFNLKTYQKIDGDDHISKRLKEQHSDPANVVTERQLDDRRVEEKVVILEKLLDSKRLGGADKVIEKNLDDSKGLFSPLRNSATYDGDINKLEEKRLKGHKTEDEKYEAASSTAKNDKWWENLKEVKTSQVDSKKKQFKIAFDEPLDDDSDDVELSKTPRKRRKLLDDSIAYPLPQPKLDEIIEKPKSLSDAEALEHGVDEEIEDKVQSIDPNSSVVGLIKEDDDVDITETDDTMGVWIDEKNGIFESRDPIDIIRFKLRFDPSEFKNDTEDLKETALDMVLERKPELRGKINIYDFSEPNMRNGTITMVLTGDQYFKDDTEEIGEGKEQPKLFDSNQLFVSQRDVDGTPMIIGVLTLNKNGITLATSDPEQFEQQVSDEIISQKPDMFTNINSLTGSFNLKNVNNGKLSFMTSVQTPEEINPELAEDLEIADMKEASNKFDIFVMGSEDNIKKK